MPNLFTSVSAGSSANFNRLLYAGGSKTGVKVVYARVRYNGTTWEVHSSTDSAELVSGNLSFSSGVLTVTLSGYTVTPLAHGTPTIAGGLLPFAVGTAASTVQVRWYDFAGALQTSASTNHDANLTIRGV